MKKYYGSDSLKDSVLEHSNMHFEQSFYDHESGEEEGIEMFEVTVKSLGFYKNENKIVKVKKTKTKGAK